MFDQFEGGYVFWSVECKFHVRRGEFPMIGLIIVDDGYAAGTRMSRKQHSALDWNICVLVLIGFHVFLFLVSYFIKFGSFLLLFWRFICNLTWG